MCGGGFAAAAACELLRGRVSRCLGRRAAYGAAATALLNKAQRAPLLSLCCRRATGALEKQGSGRTGSDALGGKPRRAQVHSPARSALELWQNRNC